MWLDSNLSGLPDDAHISSQHETARLPIRILPSATNQRKFQAIDDVTIAHNTSNLKLPRDPSQVTAKSVVIATMEAASVSGIEPGGGRIP